MFFRGVKFVFLGPAFPEFPEKFPGRIFRNFGKIPEKFPENLNLQTETPLVPGGGVTGFPGNPRRKFPGNFRRPEKCVKK